MALDKAKNSLRAYKGKLTTKADQCRSAIEMSITDPEDFTLGILSERRNELSELVGRIQEATRQAVELGGEDSLQQLLLISIFSSYCEVYPGEAKSIYTQYRHTKDATENINQILDHTKAFDTYFSSHK